MASARNGYDVVIVGGGHNGLVSAAYLARTGLSVLVLERLGEVGGAIRSAPASALVAPLPEQLVADLGLDLTTQSRPLVLDDRDQAAWRELQADLADLAHVVAPTLLQPLPLERDVRDRVDPGLWRDFVTTPLGETVEARLADDAARGLAVADALLGTSAGPHDPSLQQNRAFLHHLLGHGAHERRVTVGGHRATVEALALAASSAGAEIVTSAGVSTIDASDGGADVTWHDGATTHTVSARHVLSDIAPWVLSILLGGPEDTSTKPEGSQLTITLPLDRLPQLLSGDPEAVLTDGLHLGAGYADLTSAYDEAQAGRLPSLLPGRVQLDTDSGRTTLTYVGACAPASLFYADPAAREAAVSRALASLDQLLVEPIGSCLSGPVEVRVPQDLERDLALPGGHVFHGELEWPWASNRARLDTPAAQWGVQTDIASVLVCGSGSRRGGGVAGLGGHSAAH